MRSVRTVFALVVPVAAFAVACDAPTEPPDQADALAPAFNVSDQHRAGVFIDLANSCGVFDATGALVLGLDADVNVFTQSQNGNAVHNCFTDVANPTGRAVRFTADDNPFGVRFPCTVFDDQGNARQTFDFHEQISASGKAHLICVVHP